MPSRVFDFVGCRVAAVCLVPESLIASTRRSGKESLQTLDCGVTSALVQVVPYDSRYEVQKTSGRSSKEQEALIEGPTNLRKYPLEFLLSEPHLVVFANFFRRTMTTPC